MPKTELDLHRWCRRNAEQFQQMEETEWAAYPTPEDRDIALVEWVVRCLGNPENTDAGEVLTAIRMNREGQHD